MIIPPSSSSSQGDNSIYRLKRGTKLSEIPPIPPNPPVPDLSSLNGPFQLAEYLSLKIKHDPHDVSSLVEVPTGDKSLGGKAPDRNVWIYEHLRRIPIDLTPLLTALLPICNRETCPEMKAHEWLYLCSAHGGGAESCSAIDYILHTLDSTTALLNSSQNFPSRMQIPPSSVSHFPSLFRRLSRIFSHAYFHHREVFILSENETSLYSRFLKLCEKFELVGSSLLPIPRDVILGSGHKDEEEEEKDDSSEEEEEDDDEEEEEDDYNRELRGRKDDESSSSSSSSPLKEKRTQSLDRSLPPSATSSSLTSTSSSKPTPPPGPTRMDTLKPDSTGNGVGTLSSNSKVSNIKPKTSPIKIDPGKGKNTLSRGKQPRATMHWAGGGDSPSAGGIPDVPSLPEQTSPEDNKVESEGETKSPSNNGNTTRDRSESIESAIHIPPELVSEPPDELKVENLENIPSPTINAENSEQEQITSGEDEGKSSLDEQEEQAKEQEEEEIIPKDEIELLEEKGELKPQTTVAPLIPPQPSSTTVGPAASEKEENTTSSEVKNDKLEEVNTDDEQSKSKSDSSEVEEGKAKGDDKSSSTDENSVPPPTMEKEESSLPIKNKNIITTQKNKATPSPIKEKSKLSSSPTLSSNSPIPSPIRGKGKLVPAEISNPSTSTSPSTTTKSSSTKPDAGADEKEKQDKQE